MSDRSPLRAKTAGGDAGRHLRRRGRALVLLALLVSSLAALAPLPAQAQAISGIQLSFGPGFPSNVTVGDQNRSAALLITNNSFGSLATVPVTVTNIRLNPSCESGAALAGAEPCATPEARTIPGPIFNIDSPATGRAGTACAGQIFVVSAPNANGTVGFTSATPVVLGPPGSPTQTCIIDFTFDVLQRPPDGDTIAVASGTASATDPTTGQPVSVVATGASSVIVVAAAAPTIRTSAAPQTITTGGTFTDTATVTGVANGPPLTDGVLFTLYRSGAPPAPPTCAVPPDTVVTTASATVTPVSPATNPPTATATFTSPALTTGQYVVVATYNPTGTVDVNYGTVSSACADPLERVTVNPLLPSIAVQKSANPNVVNEPGGPVTFTVRVINTGPNDVTLTSLVDNVYGNLNGQGTCVVAPAGSRPPTPPVLSANGGTFTCSFTGQVPAAGAGAAGQSQTDTVTAIGTDAAGNTATANANATVNIVGVAPTIAVIKDASPLTQPEPTGTFTFTVRVRNDSPVESVTIRTLVDNVYGDITTRPGSTCGALVGTVLAPGQTSAPCSFTGTFTGVGGQTQTDIVTATATDTGGRTATASDDAVVGLTTVLPQVRVVKSANPTTQPAPTGTFTYTAVVSNPGTKTITIDSLVDNVYGDLATRAGSTCGALIGTTLAAGASSAPCTFTGTFTGAPGATETDTITVTAHDAQNNTVTDIDSAVVTLTAAPSILVVKKADPSSLPQPGGTFTFSAQVTNTSPEALTITSLVDNIYGDLATRPGSTCGALIGTTLAPGASSPVCTFTGDFTGPGGSAQTDTITVTGRNAAGTTVTDTDQATVRITNVTPVVAVRKTASPLTRPAPGGDFTFTAVVSNPGPEPVTITALTDNIYGDLATRPGSTCGALIGTVLAPGASSAPCTFTGPFTGAAGASQTDVITVTATDTAGTVVTATDHATVTIISITPSIRVDKTATPLSMPAPGGTFTFNVVVTNTGPNALTLTALTDNVYGDLSTRGTCTTAIGTVLASGASYSCTFPGNFTGVGGAQQVDTVTATGVDANGTSVNDTDDATVTLTAVTPTVRVVKSANPLSLPEPGGQFTFTAVVTNTSTEPVTVTSLIDDVYGNLATRPGSTCGTVVGTVLAPGASAPACSFTGNFFGDAGASQTDTITVVVTDTQGQTATDTDRATVTLSNVPPTITVDKTATPLSLPAPGGTFTFDVKVTNTSFESVRITSLTDNVYGNLDGRGTCAIGATLAPNGGTYSCSFTGPFNGAPNASQTDTVSVVAVDNEGTPVTATDNATVTLTPPGATLKTTASAGVVGGEVFDTATLAGGFNPTGTITFRLFNNETCTGQPVFTNVKQVTGTTDPRVILSDRFILPASGTYHFVASYSGDVSNAAIPATPCLDPDETVAAGVAAVAITTNASPGISLGGSMTDTATLTSAFNATGTITFTTFGPDDATCTGTPVFTSVKQVNGNGNYTSDPFTPTQPGLYRFRARYSGDPNNAAATTSCNDPLEQVQVTPVPTLRVDKTAAPETLPAPGGTATFTVVVTNTSNVALTIVSLNDNVYGDVTKIAGSSCVNAVGTVLTASPGPGNTFTCKFDGAVTGPGGSSQTDIVTAMAKDSRGNVVRAQDDATVRITAVPPTITTTKVATFPSLPEPGGAFTFNYSVTNTGPEPVTVTSLVDDVYGNLNGKGTCAVGARLVGNGGTYRCSFTANFFANAGATQTDTITTTAVDDHGQTVTSVARATVAITDVPPTFTIVKSPDPISRPEPGGSFRFTATITNTSFEPVTITSLVDDVYGNLNGRGSCAVGVVLAANGGSYSCAFDGDFRGRGGDSQVDTITAVVVDNDNTSATAKASARVSLTPVNTPVVVQPQPPVVVTPVTVTPPVQVQQVLVRTGSNTLRQARLAALFLLFGLTLLVAASWRFGNGGPGLMPVPSGPDDGPGPRGGGLPSDGTTWFGHEPPRPPKGPLAGFGLARTLPPEPEAPGREVVDDWAAVLATPERPSAVPEPMTTEVAVVEAEPVVDVAPAVVVAPAVEPQVDTAVVPEVVVPEVVVPEVVVPEVVVPTVVQVRATGGLDAVAMDAANAESFRPRAEPAPGRRSRKFGSR